MKVAHVLHAMKVGGAEVLVANVVRRQRQEGRHEAVVVCLDELGMLGSQLRDEGSRVEVLGRKPGIDFGLFGRARRLFRELEVDVVHCHQYTPWFYGGAAAAREGLGVVFTEHGRHQPDHPRPKRVIFNQWLHRRTGAITAVSRSLRQALIDNEKLPGDRIEVLYNGIDQTRFHPDAELRETTRRQMGWPDDTVVVGTAGRLVEVKNQDLLLRAAAALRDRTNTPFIVQLAGDGPLREGLERRIAELDLAERVQLLGEREDVPALLQAWDVFALSSFSEGTSITLLEAMASGKPVVATRVGGNPELVAEGVEGRLVPSDDADAFAGALASLVDDPAARRAMGEAGVRNVERRFTFEAMLRRFEEIHAGVLRK